MVMLGFTVRVVVPRGESTVMVGTVGKLRLFVSWIGRVWDMVDGAGNRFAGRGRGRYRSQVGGNEQISRPRDPNNY